MRCPAWTKGRVFSMKQGGSRPRRVSACGLVRDNADDSYLRKNLRRLKPGGVFKVGGGAAPLTVLRRTK